MVQIKIKQKGANETFRRIEDKLINGARKTAKLLAQLGLAKAQQLVPKASGKTAGAITAKPKEMSKRRTSWVITANEVYDFPVVKVMGGDSEYAKEHWRKRTEKQRKFMLTTKNYLNDIKSGVAKGGFRNIDI
jgi:hypothetical protein